MYKFARSLLFRLDPESAHLFTLYALRITGALPPLNWIIRLMYYAPAQPVSAFGLRFKNPIGLAAGYDKDALAISGLSMLGFGHIEAGTVTPLRQDGNPKPRLFRLVEDQAVINRMGFPSRGSSYVLSAVRRAAKKRNKDVILGVNLGRNRNVPNEEAVIDYLSLLQIFAPFADYLAINVSSPNTPGLRQLQGRAALEGLLTQLHAQRRMEEKRLEKRLPLLVKLAPDLSESEVDDALGVILQTRMDGVIATNTTLAREGLRSKHRGESGGLSGSPLRVRSEAVLRQIVKRVGGQIPVVSVGGIMNPEDAKRRLDLGAALIQLYTGLIYNGPGLVKAIARSL